MKKYANIEHLIIQLKNEIIELKEENKKLKKELRNRENKNE